MNDKVNRILKKAIKVLFRTCLEELWRTTSTSEERQCHGQDLSWACPKYKCRALLPHKPAQCRIILKISEINRA
jgi:hypothetical protein